VQTVSRLKQHKQSIIHQHARPDDVQGLQQVLTTLAPLTGLWLTATLDVPAPFALYAAVILVMSMFLLRVFVLMHECGHGSLFRTPALNRAFGFIFGVLSGMPQFVWSQHHHFHHSTNGNWDQYRGPLTIVTVREYAEMDERQRRRYRRARSIWLAPIAGLLYLVVNPRLTWIKGSARLLLHLLRGKLTQPRLSLREHAARFTTVYWSSRHQYWHMFWNNLALFGFWIFMAWAIGPGLFFAIYLPAMALAGAAGIVLFTVQHNFEDSYASGDEHWCYDTAALHGTSFLVLPRWLNWFTANIAYHHIHHLSARIPNYRLADCHDQHSELFADVRRVRLDQIGEALQFILWDTQARRLVTAASVRT
jgi:acyl-lipid omega-6 desaturase (Delta-12 desaturase)